MSEAQVNIKTSCSHCVFAKYDGLTQIGCEFNRIEKYQKQTEVKLIDDGAKKYYEIDKRICNYCSIQDNFGDLPYAEIKKKVVNDNKVHVALMIKENMETVKDVEYYIKKKLPVDIHIISYADNYKSQYSHPNVFYHYIMEEMTDDALNKHICVKGLNCLYFAKSRHKSARFGVNEKVLKELESEINDNLSRPMIVEAKTYIIAHRRGLLNFNGSVKQFKKAISTHSS